MSGTGLMYGNNAGAIVPVKVAPDGTLATSSGAQAVRWNWSRFPGLAASGNAKAAAGDVYAARCVNLNINIRYFQIFNLAAAPAAGATPLMSLPVFGGSGLLILGEADFSSAGMSFTTGISWGFSTTPLIFTAGAGADAIVEIGFI